MPGLELFLHNEFVGVVERSRRDKTRVELSVDNGYSNEGIVLSESFATLTGRRAPAGAVTNFLGGYVPEGNHREQMAAKRHVDSSDLFALLSEFGGSVAGAVTVRRADDLSSPRPAHEPLTERALEKVLKQALTESDQGIPDDSRSTLPGFQPKVLVSRVDGEWASPHGRAHSTYILKPQVPARPTRLFDEHFSHLLTQRIGLSSYSSEIHTAGRTRYLAIERFDRTLVAGAVQLRHQEDLAQALDLDWLDADAKFQAPSWPGDPRRATARRIAELLGSLPGADRVIDQWLQQLTFHLAIGNNDAHAKNIALMHLETGTELSPVYDALPNLFQPGLVKWDLALAVDGVFDHRRISIDRILTEVKSWGVVSEARATELVRTTLDSISSALDVVSAPRGASPGMVDRLKWNVSRLLAGTTISEPKR